MWPSKRIGLWWVFFRGPGRLRGRLNPCVVKEERSGETKPCIFPFQFEEKMYNGCTTAGFPEPWCSTKVDPINSVHVTSGNFFGNCPKSETCPLHLDEWKNNPFDWFNLYQKIKVLTPIIKSKEIVWKNPRLLRSLTAIYIPLCLHLLIGDLIATKKSVFEKQEWCEIVPSWSQVIDYFKYSKIQIFGLFGEIANFWSIRFSYQFILMSI